MIVETRQNSNENVWGVRTQDTYAPWLHVVRKQRQFYVHKAPRGSLTDLFSQRTRLLTTMLAPS